MTEGKHVSAWRLWKLWRIPFTRHLPLWFKPFITIELWDFRQIVGSPLFPLVCLVSCYSIAMMLCRLQCLIVCDWCCQLWNIFKTPIPPSRGISVEKLSSRRRPHIKLSQAGPSRSEGLPPQGPKKLSYTNQSSRSRSKYVLSQWAIVGWKSNCLISEYGCHPHWIDWSSARGKEATKPPGP